MHRENSIIRSELTGAPDATSVPLIFCHGLFDFFLAAKLARKRICELKSVVTVVIFLVVGKTSSHPRISMSKEGF